MSVPHIAQLSIAHRTAQTSSYSTSVPHTASPYTVGQYHKPPTIRCVSTTYRIVIRYASTAHRAAIRFGSSVPRRKVPVVTTTLSVATLHLPPVIERLIREKGGRKGGRKGWMSEWVGGRE
eukprot:3940753-Rhodomonas_salina.1